MTATLPRTGTQPEVPGALPPGTLLDGRFELHEPLGRGGMGTVYRARDVTLDEVVAIKLMRGEFAENPRMAERFKSEIKLARRVRHRNVCAIHDYGEVDGKLYISMELVDGSDLKRHLQRRGALPHPEAYTVALQIAEGLQAVHDAGIVHRDLKPSNVVFGTDGQARLMDFGIAKRQQGDGQAITATGDVVGTPEYMSPEQAQGRALDARSDVYALGVLVYELFTGHLPFRGDTPISTILKHIQDPPPLEGPPAAHIPPAVRAVLKRALAKDAAQRYADARAMGDALRAARDAPSSAPRSRALPVVAAGAAALVIAGVAAAVVSQRNETPGAVGTPAPVLPTATPAPAATATPLPAATAPVVITAPAAMPSPRAAATPRPTPVPATPRPATPAPAAPPPTTVSARPGQLQVVVRPWAEVTVDGRVHGETPLGAIGLPAGDHVVRLRHPGYEPLERTVRVPPGETVRLVVDLAAEGKRR